MRVSMFQYPIVWEDKRANLDKIEFKLVQEKLVTDLLVLPEMFTTGFGSRAMELAESNDGETISRVKKWAALFQMAVVGSFIAEENDKLYNRAFFVVPDGESFFYDKRHLFSIGSENMIFSSGNKKIIVSYKGWNICLQVCYDLRFPVWSRNIKNEYDLLIYVANWPASRISSWNALLPARAVENLSYVCGVNRVGVDGLQIKHDGYSAIYDMKGQSLVVFEPEKEEIRTITLSLEQLREFREKFPAWKDADEFSIKNLVN